MSIQTIKLSYQSEHQNDIQELQRQLSISTRYAYNRSKNCLTQKQTRNLIKTLNNVSNDAFLNHCAVIQGFDIHKSAKTREQDKLIFAKKSFELRKASKISSQQWKQQKLLPIYSIGECLQKGNRKFKLDLANNRIIFKLK